MRPQNILKTSVENLIEESLLLRLKFLETDECLLSPFNNFGLVRMIGIRLLAIELRVFLMEFV